MTALPAFVTAEYWKLGGPALIKMLAEADLHGVKVDVPANSTVADLRALVKTAGQEYRAKAREATRAKLAGTTPPRPAATPKADRAALARETAEFNAWLAELPPYGS